MLRFARPIVFSLGAALLFAAPLASASEIVDFAQAAPHSKSAAAQKTYLKTQSSFDKFIPRPKTNKTLDFSTLDAILDTSVLYTGPSTRRRAPYRRPALGSRIRKNIGHTSPYQLEGNKVILSAFNAEYKASLSGYQDELEQLGNKVDISALPRNEQLAYWFNLHNLTVMDIIAQHYPVRHPSEILIGPNKTPVQEAKLLSIKGQPLSLRDIREKIVFANWKNPNVIYGFWYGDLGSPSLQTRAFTGKNISSVLDFSAYEFANSLRAINNSNSKVFVSELYYQAAPYYFPNFEADLTAHLRPHLRDDVKVLLDNYSSIQPDDYQTDTADLTGGIGNRLPSGSSTVNRFALTENGLQVGIAFTRDIFVNQLYKKRETLARQGRLGTSKVFITDIETEDRQIPEIE